MLALSDAEKVFSICREIYEVVRKWLLESLLLVIWEIITIYWLTAMRRF
jgi:asparagine N-glycosylation enzyme membrane subunit Stt3